MPRDANGVYTFPASSWNPAVPGTTITSTDWNNLRSDLESNMPVYVQGTWTPTFSAVTPPTGVTYTTQTGTYTKTGRLVFAQCQMTLSSKGSGGSGAATLGGFPFGTVGTGGRG